MRITFHGGVHPPTQKEGTADKPIRKAPLPRQVILSLIQHTGAPCEPVVSVGDNVKTGQLIGTSDKFISSPIHASISGRVAKIEKNLHPVIGNHKAVVIESDGKDQKDPSIKENREVPRLSAAELIGTIKAAGIVGLGGATFPTHVKLSPPKGKTIDTIILNGAECEPYLTCDYRLMFEKAQEVLEGLKIILKVTNAPNAYIGIESNKMAAFLAFEKALKKDTAAANAVRILLVETKYPQGAEKQLIKAILKRDVPAGGLPLDVGCVVQNVGTALSIYEAVYKGKPLYERVVTITGDCIKEPSNLLVRIGTPIKDLVDNCGGFVKDPAKILLGGPMMGIAQYTADMPIIKGSNGVIFLSKDKVREFEEGVCIRCGRCIDACPMNLAPTTIMNYVKKERFPEAKETGVMLCFECGACAYECPAKIPLVDYMKFGKAKAQVTA